MDPKEAERLATDFLCQSRYHKCNDCETVIDLDNYEEDFSTHVSEAGEVTLYCSACYQFED